QGGRASSLPQGCWWRAGQWGSSCTMGSGPRGTISCPGRAGAPCSPAGPGLAHIGGGFIVLAELLSPASKAWLHSVPYSGTSVEAQLCRCKVHSVNRASVIPQSSRGRENVSMNSSKKCALPAPTLYLSQTSARPRDSVRLQCSVFSWALATRIIFFKDGEEVSSQRSLLRKFTYNYDHVVSGGSSGNYSCGYEIKDSDNQVTRSQLSPAQHLSVTGPAMSPAVWTARCILVLILLVSAPIITFLLEKWGLSEPTGLEETRGGSSSIMRRRGAESERISFSSCEQWRQ
ncbi:hypothetical protein KIL84_001692, partial [Mauremys mutica]